MKARILGFDGLRAIAVLLVILTHKTSQGDKLGLGGYGVHLFFVLSGFLIIGILHGRRQALETGAASWRREFRHFYENRLFRIWPLYYLVVTACIILGLVGAWRQMSPSELVGTLTYTSNWFQAYVWKAYPHHFGHLWSVAIEEQFYLWAAPVFLLTPHRHFKTICLAVIVLAVTVGSAHIALGFPNRANYVGSFTNFGLMALGGWAAVAIKPNRLLARAAPFALLLYLIAPVAAYVVGRGSLTGTVIFWSSGLLIALALPGIVADQKSLLVRILSLPPVAYFGMISYGVYIFHPMIELADYGFDLPRPVAGAIETALTFIVASISWFVLEKPLLNLRDRLRRRSETSLAQGGARTSAA
ncbi:acyltransferase family protein [Caulobacter hibisci]|uniref:Acyltransferase n=1 Tax=Caulobacter hibisci TaxID=2035993 RepID=A0ABS0SSN7_9CAUL|nr:acyltransferase [Caulobacter hibisci]MBI1682541.1 acyltransferase [Caulobacter hibisci]